MFSLSKLQSIADGLGSIAMTAAEIFDPSLVPTITIANKVIATATDLVTSLHNTGLDQAVLQAGLQALVDKVEAHSKEVEAKLGPDESA